MGMVEVSIIKGEAEHITSTYQAAKPAHVLPGCSAWLLTCANLNSKGLVERSCLKLFTLEMQQP